MVSFANRGGIFDNVGSDFYFTVILIIVVLSDFVGIEPDCHCECFEDASGFIRCGNVFIYKDLCTVGIGCYVFF